MKAEVTFIPSAKQRMAVFFMRMTVLHPKSEVVMKLDTSGIVLECAGVIERFERE